MLWPAQVVLVFCTAQKQMPLVLKTKVTHFFNLLFRQQDGVNKVVRRIYLAITAKLVQTE